MSIIRLYPPVKVAGQDFSKAKIVVVPQQSMTLKEIIKRFIRKESLPIEKEGIYEERMGDLEKLAKSDITYRMEKAESLDKVIKKRQKAEADAAAKKALESPLPAPAPSGAVTGSAGSGQAPAPSTTPGTGGVTA